jgi:hypothetical protein
MHIRWKPDRGETLILGSNRLDFLPEIYGNAEIVRMENGAIHESRPNKNLLATIPAGEGEAYVPFRTCYRLIARHGAALSVPPLSSTPGLPRWCCRIATKNPTWLSSVATSRWK